MFVWMRMHRDKCFCRTTCRNNTMQRLAVNEWNFHGSKKIGFLFINKSKVSKKTSGKFITLMRNIIHKKFMIHLFLKNDCGLITYEDSKVFIYCSADNLPFKNLKHVRTNAQIS